MGIRHDVKEGLKKYEIPRSEGQPTDEDVNLLTKELTNAAGSVTTQNQGREHSHVGMVVEQAEYVTFSQGNAPFVVPTNPGPYPAIVNPDAVIRERQIAKHKAEIVEYKTYLGVENYLRQMIVKSVDHEWIAEVKSETMGFNHLSLMQLLTHLHQVGGSLDHMDVTELISNLQKPWDGIETPGSHFARGDKYERQFLKVGQARNPELRLAFALRQENTKHLSANGKPHTFANFCVFMQQEYGKHHKQNKSTAASVGRGIANSLTEKPADQLDHLKAHAILLAEVANSIHETSQKQFKEMMELFAKTLASKDLPNAQGTDTGVKKKKKKKRCPHCLLEVYHMPEKCFEVKANASKRPEGCVEVKSTEQWRPDEVDITKITKRFPYLVAAGFDPPPPDALPPIQTSVPVPDHGPRPISKLSRRWARQLER
eukprot:CCRYP_002951-RA/>CCRYP_002951-RA protein AED:0.36 eAED:0.36 QI:0/0/0/1/0.5/0.33/3/0/427